MRITGAACFAAGPNGSRNSNRIALVKAQYGSEDSGVSLDTLRRENELLQASISEAEQQVGQLELQLDNGQGQTAISPAAGSPAPKYVDAGTPPKLPKPPFAT